MLEGAPGYQQPTADLPLDLISNAAAREEVVPIMGAHRADLELVRCELADGQRQNDAIRAEAANANRNLESDIFTVAAKRAEKHTRCIRRHRADIPSPLLDWILHPMPSSNRPRPRRNGRSTSKPSGRKVINT